MDEEVAAITSNSPLPTSPAAESPELKESVDEQPDDTAHQNGETVVDSEDKSDKEVKEDSKDNDEKEDIVNDDGDDDDGDDSEDEEENALEGGLDSNLNEDQLCRICGEKYKQPRILSCLHLFCTPCLEKQLEDGDQDGDQDSIAEGTGKKKDSLKCTHCKQTTTLTGKGVEDLPLDTVMINILDMAAMNDPQIVCTSCKAREKAVARCNDCASFLCPNCVTAHQYMRCFENHKVVEHKVYLFCTWIYTSFYPILCEVCYSIYFNNVAGGVV